MLQFLGQPWVGSILGIVGVSAAIVFYLRSRQVSRLSFQREHHTIIGGANAAFPKEVTIYYEGKPVDMVTATRYVIWNSGNTTLHGNQIVETDSLRLELVGEGRVLKTTLLNVTRKVNGVTFSPWDPLHWSGDSTKGHRVVKIDFDYLDPGDGLAIEVIYSGTNSLLTLDGTLRGLPSGLTDFGRSASEFTRRTARFMKPFGLSSGVFTAAVAVFSFGAFFLLPWLTSQPTVDKGVSVIATDFRWLLVLNGIMYGIISWRSTVLSRRRYPQSLDVYEDSPK